MSKKAFKVVAIISLVLCVIFILVAIITLSDFPVPTLDNTTVLYLTVERIEKGEIVYSKIFVKESENGSLLVNNQLVSNFDAFVGLSQGDKISVRVYLKEALDLTNHNIEIWALNTNDVTVMSFENVTENKMQGFNESLITLIVIICPFAVVSIVCFCGYKGVFSKRKV